MSGFSFDYFLVGEIKEFSLIECQSLTGLDVLEDDPIWPGRFLISVKSQVDDPEQTTEEQARIVSAPGWVNDDFPVIAIDVSP